MSRSRRSGSVQGQISDSAAFTNKRDEFTQLAQATGDPGLRERLSQAQERTEGAARCFARLVSLTQEFAETYQHLGEDLTAASDAALGEAEALAGRQLDGGDLSHEERDWLRSGLADTSRTFAERFEHFQALGNAVAESVPGVVEVLFERILVPDWRQCHPATALAALREAAPILDWSEQGEALRTALTADAHGAPSVCDSLDDYLECYLTMVEDWCRIVEVLDAGLGELEQAGRGGRSSSHRLH